MGRAGGAKGLICETPALSSRHVKSQKALELCTYGVPNGACCCVIRLAFLLDARAVEQTCDVAKDVGAVHIVPLEHDAGATGLILLTPTLWRRTVKVANGQGSTHARLPL